MSTGESPFEWTETRLRVRYAETDQMGIVYYANFLVWFEIGRTDFCRQHGFAYREMEQQDGLYIIVAEARCRYKAPARYDEELSLTTRVVPTAKCSPKERPSTSSRTATAARARCRISIGRCSWPE